MNNEEEIRTILGEIYEKGFEIKNILEKKYNNYTRRTKEEILTDPNLFYYSLFRDFWELFKILSNNIKNPLIQPWIRVIIEQSSNLFWYSEKKEEDKKEIACKYFLCVLGSIGGKQGDLEYNKFLKLLKNGSQKFIELKEKGYPIKEVHQIQYNLFPSVNEKKLSEKIEKYYLTVKNNGIKKFQIEIFFKYMSLYHHPSLLINNLEKEFSDKSHLFRCFAILSMCGIGLIRFSMEEILNDSNSKPIEELSKKINILFEKIYLNKK